MSVNEKVKSSLKRGDIKKIAEYLNVSPQTVTERIKSDKEIDSVSFINAVCKVTEKPFSHFVKLDNTYAISEKEMADLVSDNDELYMNTKAAEDAHIFWRKKAVKHELQEEIAVRAPFYDMTAIMDYVNSKNQLISFFTEEELNMIIVNTMGKYYDLKQEHEKNKKK